jgi:hypothetical protein
MKSSELGVQIPGPVEHCDGTHRRQGHANLNGNVNDPQGNPVTTYGNVVTVWRKDADGSWRNVVDMWNEAPRRD